MSMPDPSTALPAPPVRTVTVTGIANATARPDRAALSLGVQARASSAREALAVAALRATAVIAVLREAGVGEGELRTTGISLWHDQSARLYVASHDLAATISPDDVGDRIDAAATAAGDEFTLNGVSFSVADPDAAIAPLRAAALADARAKADALAEAEGCTVGDVITIIEGGGGGAVPFPGAVRARLAIPIEVGSESLSIKVVATYQLVAASA
jgi:uncharacterized protein YggE